MRIEWMEIHLAEAERMILNDRIGEGLDVLNDLLYDEPGYGRLHNHLGWAYANFSEDEARAELHLKMAVRFDESYAPPYLHLGALYMRQRRYSDAVAYSEAGLTKSKSNRVGLLQNLAAAYELRKDWRQAIKAYKDALMESVGDYEVTSLQAGIKRCRKKKIVLFFGL